MLKSLALLAFTIISNHTGQKKAPTGEGGGGERGIRTLENEYTPYTVSNRAPSANSDISPHEINT
jgi:hypothetical protein